MYYNNALHAHIAEVHENETETYNTRFTRFQPILSRIMVCNKTALQFYSR